jgi:hypothetical protein
MPQSNIIFFPPIETSMQLLPTSFYLVYKKRLSGGSAKKRPFEKIVYFVSTSHVDFLKAHIKIS